jgi:tetratricopeptide (TPR) repeat protein
MCNVRLGIVLGVIAAALVPPARAGEKDWTGKIIIIKHTKVHIGYTDDNGRHVTLTRLGSIYYYALGEEDGWIKVRHDEHVGWFDKAQAVLLDDAEAYFTGLLSSDPTSAQSYARRGYARYILGEYNKAIADYQAAITVNPTQSAWYQNRGIIYRTMRDYEASIRDFTRVAQLDRNEAYPYNNRGWSHGLNKQFDKAIADFDTSLRISPNNLYAYNFRGIVYGLAGQYERALEDFGRVQQLDPKFPWAYYNRAKLRHKQGEYALALADFEKARQLEPHEWEIPADFAWLLATCPDAKVRDPKLALQLATEACKYSHYRNANNLRSLAAACAANGQYDDAVKWERKALENPGYAREEKTPAEERLARYSANKPYILAAGGKGSATEVPEPKVASKLPETREVDSGPIKGWRELKSEEGRFTAAFPKLPSQQRQKIASPVGNVELSTLSYEGDGLAYVVGYFDLPQDGILTIDNAATAYANGRKATLVSQKAIMVGGVAGREVVARLPDNRLSRVRLVFVGPRLYQVIVDGPADLVNSAQTTGYLDSFKLNR